MVELALPLGPFRSVFLEIDAFHRERRIPVRRGRNRHEVKQVYIRFCFRERPRRRPAAESASNSRRPMVTVMRPSRARCVKGTIPRHERAVFTFKEAGCWLLRPQSSASTALLPPPALRERRHRGLVRHLVAVRGCGALMRCPKASVHSQGEPTGRPRPTT